MQIDFATLFKVANHILDARLPLLIRGRHGIGKSEVVYQLARARKLPVVERRASHMTEGDLLGLPSLDEEQTSWNPPNWFKTACNSPVLLFLDEIDRATLEVRQGIFELTDSRKLSGFTLHPETLIVAAVNGGQNGAEYQVGEMDPAELDRWTVFDVNPTVEDWINWARQDNINPIMIDFINHNPNHLEHKDTFEPNKKYPSRRSWKRFNDAMESAGYYDEWVNEVRILGLGFLGYEAAIAFSDFYEKYDRQVTPQDILDGKLELTKNFNLVEHVALIEKMQQQNIFKEELEQEKLDNIARYLVSLPSEAAMKLVYILNCSCENMVKIAHSKEVNVVEFLGRMVAPDDSKTKKTSKEK